MKTIAVTNQDRAREIRECMGVSLQDAAEIVRKENLLGKLNAATTIDDLKLILNELIVRNRA